jgi:hypothetical protein
LTRACIVAIEAQLENPEDKERVRRFTKARLLILTRQPASHPERFSDCALELSPGDRLFLPIVESVIKDLRVPVKHLEESEETRATGARRRMRPAGPDSDSLDGCPWASSRPFRV